MVEQDGVTTLPYATGLLINADGGGSNSCRVRLWKEAMQKIRRRDRAA
ncbi:MAG: hypothetical protein JZU65_02125 [Chlorobium sp.]|nr:hypothetical protein [Chlorobium sp.]